MGQRIHPELDTPLYRQTLAEQEAEIAPSVPKLSPYLARIAVLAGSATAAAITLTACYSKPAEIIVIEEPEPEVEIETAAPTPTLPAVPDRLVNVSFASYTSDSPSPETSPAEKPISLEFSGNTETMWEEMAASWQDFVQNLDFGNQEENERIKSQLFQPQEATFIPIPTEENQQELLGGYLAVPGSEGVFLLSFTAEHGWSLLAQGKTSLETTESERLSSSLIKAEDDYFLSLADYYFPLPLTEKLQKLLGEGKQPQVLFDKKTLALGLAAVDEESRIHYVYVLTTGEELTYDLPAPEPTTTPLPTETPPSTLEPATPTPTKEPEKPPRPTSTPEPAIAVSGEQGAWLRQSPWGEKVALLPEGSVIKEVLAKSPSGEWLQVKVQIGEEEKTAWIYGSLISFDSEKLANLETIEVEETPPTPEPPPTPESREIFLETISPPSNAGRPFGNWQAPNPFETDKRSAYGQLKTGYLFPNHIEVYINISNDPNQEDIFKAFIPVGTTIGLAINNPPQVTWFNSLEELAYAGRNGDIIVFRTNLADYEAWQQNPSQILQLIKLCIIRYF